MMNKRKAVAIAIAAYTMITVLIWYVFGADDMNKYLITKLGGEPRLLMDGRPNVEDILVNNAQGLLGRFMGILLNTVFPYIVLGSLFGISAGGQSLIKIAFLCTRRLRGGPAHAAIVSSAMFGTISGGPVVNVLSTGVLTIPMMLKRGFSKVFAGGVEAAASSGGQIMPPVMGVAAFVLSAMTVVPYREVIIAAVIPALAYFGCLFLSVVFQARKQGIQAVGELTADMKLTRDDWIHLIMIVAPILLILFLLILALFNLFSGSGNTLQSRSVPYSEFVAAVEGGEVNQVTLDGETIRYRGTDGNVVLQSYIISDGGIMMGNMKAQIEVFRDSGGSYQNYISQ